MTLSTETSCNTILEEFMLIFLLKKGNILEYRIENMENGNSKETYYIPQGVSLDLIKSILAHCYSSQKRGQTITSDSLKQTILKSEKTVGNALKILENIGILTLDTGNNTYHLNDVAMSFAEKLNTSEDVTKEVNQIIENSFLSKILQIITTNQNITKPQLVEKIMINSAAGNVADKGPYMTTIYCILEILNLSGKIPLEKYSELRSNPEQATKRTHTSIGPKKPEKKREKDTVEGIDTSLAGGILGIVKTSNIEVKIKNKEDLEFAKLVLANLEKTLSGSPDNNTSSPTPQSN